MLGRRVRLLTHPRVAARLWDGHLAGSMAESYRPEAQAVEQRRFEDFFELCELDEARAVRWGPFTIRCRFTNHSIPTTALRIEAGGRSVGYSADTGYDPALIEWLAAADLVIHEVNRGVHTPYERLAALPASLRARMRLIHYPDDFDLEGSVIAPLRVGEPVVV